MTVALPAGTPGEANAQQPDDDITEPVGRHLTLVASSGITTVGAARKASMARHPSAARPE